jgi:hypothetical protein
MRRVRKVPIGSSKRVISLLGLKILVSINPRKSAFEQ